MVTQVCVSKNSQSCILKLVHLSGCKLPLHKKFEEQSAGARPCLPPPTLTLGVRGFACWGCPASGRGCETSSLPPFRPQSSLAQWGASAAIQVVSRRSSEVRVPWLHNLTATREEDHNDQMDTEGEETEVEEEESETEENKLSEVRERAEAEWDAGNWRSHSPPRG